MKKENDSPGILIPPPLVFAIGLIAGGVLTWFFPIAAPAVLVRSVIGGILVTIGLATLLSVYIAMRRAKTNIEPWKPTTTIIESGFYRYSRNPIYVAMAVTYAGVAVTFALVWSFVFLPVCLLFIHFFQILPEERYLEAKFGSNYVAYRSRVRRWI